MSLTLTTGPSALSAMEESTQQGRLIAKENRPGRKGTTPPKKANDLVGNSAAKKMSSGHAMGPILPATRCFSSVITSSDPAT